MKHLSEANLALYAGQDLGSLARWWTARHLARCAQCRAQVTEYSALRQEVTGLNDMPDIAWNRLGAEMKANIRLGLAAGECIRRTTAIEPLFAGARLVVACASMALLLLAGVWIERPALRPSAPSAVAEARPGISLHAIENGVEVRQGDEAFVLKNGASENVTYSAGAQGSIGARIVDPATGYVTINTVYVQ